MNKKYLPFVLLGIGILVFLGVVLLIRRGQNSGQAGNNTDDGTVAQLPDEQKPTAELLPSSDGHWLRLRVINTNKVQGVVSMDYELLYKVASGQTQGVPGTIQLATNVNPKSTEGSPTFPGASSSGSQSFVERDLLLGSESSGKFRYDVGVETGTLTLRFRDGNGKLLGKLMTDFHYQTGTTALSSVDGTFKYVLAKSATGVWFVTMQTFGKDVLDSVVVTSNGYSIFASDGLAHSGK